LEEVGSIPGRATWATDEVDYILTIQWIERTSVWQVRLLLETSLLKLLVADNTTINCELEYMISHQEVVGSSPTDATCQTWHRSAVGRAPFWLTTSLIVF
jgi:hypothetical protein